MEKVAETYVVLIGAANIDIQGFPFSKLIQRDSNPGVIRVCPGGVSRNIAENLSRMGVSVELVTAIGGGVNGRYLTDSCRECGIGIEHSLVFPEEESSTYLAIMNVDGDMELALSDMRISDRITVEYIKSIDTLLRGAALIEIDPCLSGEVIQYILMHYSSIPLYIDPVSIGKSKKIKDRLGGIHTLKLNEREAGFLCGYDVNSKETLLRAAEDLLDKGVFRVFITRGAGGVYYSDGTRSGTVLPPDAEVSSATGAGDAFMAGVIFSALHGYSLKESAVFATGASVYALMSEDTVNRTISVRKIENIVKEIQ